MEKDRNPYATGERLDHEGLFSTVTEIQNNPNYIAKTLELNFDYSYGSDMPPTYKEQVEKFIEDAKLLKKHFGEHIPEFHIAMGHGPETANEEVRNGTPVVFMKKVIAQPQTLEELKNDFKEIIIPQMDDIYAAGIDLFLETFDGNSGEVVDMFRSSNMMYGTTNTDERPRLYFVDFYPIFRWDPNTLFNMLNGVVNKSTYEDVANNPDYFSKTKQAMLKIKRLIKE